MRPRLLDAFSGAGGCARGYQQAGFHVTGIDVKPQPRYAGDRFIQGDALEFIREYGHMFDAIHASPPCQAFSFATHFRPRNDHSDLVVETRRLLDDTSVPYVIENVERAPLRKDLLLCGEMFGLRLHRHRAFETSGFFAMQPRHAPHRLKGAPTNCHDELGYTRMVVGNFADLDSASAAMGIDWMTRDELREAIPPAYTQHVGYYLMAELLARAAA